MKRWVSIAAMLLGFLCISYAQQLDSAKRVALDAKLAEYVAAIETAGTEAQKEECDFLIQSCTDSLVRQFVALNLYDRYMSSKLMGAEAVAIHILDRWFFTGEVKMPDEIDLLNARVYADFNRSSQIGMKAPVLDVTTIAGDPVTLYREPARRYSVLYFYDTDCSKCKVETILLRSLLEDEDYPIDLYAFYTGDKKADWEAYVSDRFSLNSDNVEVLHLWDPELDSDFQRKYGVLQTPKMYLVRPDGRIAGRELDARALYQLLSPLFEDVSLEYGGPEAMGLYARMFQDGLSEDGVKAVSDMIAESTLTVGDTLMFRQMAGDLLYYLASETGKGAKEGLAYHIDKYIINDSGKVWKTFDDSLKVVGFAGIMDDLLSKSAPGTRISDIKVPGVLISGAGDKSKIKSLRKLGGKHNVIIFHTEGCNICKAEIEAAHKLAQEDRKTRIYLVNVDDILVSAPSLAATLFDRFDLASLPYILFTDKKGYIQSRYETLQN